MKTAVLLSALPILLFGAGCTANPAIENVRIVPATNGSALLRACSRAAPENASGFFAPSPAQITAVETATARTLRAAAADYTSYQDDTDAFAWPDDPSLYRRRYVGYVVDGRRMIYGDFKPASFGLSADEELMTLCDGGPQFFGVEYDLARDSVRRIAFDGSLGGPFLPTIEPKP